MRDIAKDRAFLKTYEDRRVRAQARLAGELENRYYIALVGLKTQMPAFDFGSAASIRQVVEPPIGYDFAVALENRGLFDVVSRWGPAVAHELSIDRGQFPNDAEALDAAWTLIAALRTSSLAQFVAPMLCNHSWSTIAAFTDHSCHVDVVEDFPTVVRLDTDKIVTREHLEWVMQHQKAFARLMISADRFRLAVNALSSCQFGPDLRMAMATIWSGLDAFFGINGELRFRVSLYASCLLESPGQGRRDLFSKMKHLYDTRSKAVHGVKFTNKQLASGASESRAVLSRLLCKATELGYVLDEESLDEWALGMSR